LKITQLIDSVLSEEPKTNISKEAKKSLKIFYKTDILIQGFPERREEEPEEVTAAKPTPIPAVPQTAAVPAQPRNRIPAAPTPTENTRIKNRLSLNEDIYKSSNEGELTVSYDEVDNIQTLEDLIDFLSDKSEGGKTIINDLVEEIIITIAGVGAKTLDKLVNEGDKVFVNIDYGKEPTDSVGIRVNKQPGSTSMSIAMKKDNQLISGEFNVEEFNKQLVFYRNALFN